MKEAHKGMLKALFISPEGALVPRTQVLKGALVSRGKDKIRALLPKVLMDGKPFPNPDVRNILWQFYALRASNARNYLI